MTSQNVFDAFRTEPDSEPYADEESLTLGEEPEKFRKGDQGERVPIENQPLQSPGTIDIELEGNNPNIMDPVIAETTKEIVTKKNDLAVSTHTTGPIEYDFTTTLTPTRTRPQETFKSPLTPRAEGARLGFGPVLKEYEFTNKTPVKNLMATFASPNLRPAQSPVGQTFFDVAGRMQQPVVKGRPDTNLEQKFPEHTQTTARTDNESSRATQRSNSDSQGPFQSSASQSKFGLFGPGQGQGSVFQGNFNMSQKKTLEEVKEALNTQDQAKTLSGKEKEAILALIKANETNSARGMQANISEPLPPPPGRNEPQRQTEDRREAPAPASVWNRTSPKFSLFDENPQLVQEEAKGDQEAPAGHDDTDEALWWTGHSDTQTDRLKTVQDLELLGDWLTQQNGHKQYMNIARCLTKIIRSQQKGHDMLQNWSWKEGGNIADFLNFILNGTGNKFHISEYEVPPELLAICGDQVQNFAPIRLAILKHSLAHYYSNLFQNQLLKLQYENKIIMPEIQNQVVKEREEWHFKGHMSNKGMLDNEVTMNGKNMFYQIHMVQQDANTGQIGNVVLGPIKSQNFNLNPSPFTLQTTVAFDLLGEFCNKTAVNATFMEQHNEHAIQVGKGNVLTEGAKIKKKSATGVSLTHLGNSIGLDKPEESVLLQKMKIQFYVNKASTKDPRPNIKVASELYSLKRDFMTKGELLMDKYSEIPIVSRENSFIMEADIIGKAKFSPVFGLNILNTFLENDGYLMVSPLLLIDNLHHEDTWSLSFTFEILRGKDYLLALYLMSLNLRSLAASSVRMAERDLLNNKDPISNALLKYLRSKVRI